MNKKHGFKAAFSILFASSVFLTGCAGNSAKTSTQPSSSGSSAHSVGQPLTILSGPAGNWQENFNPFSTSALIGTNGLIYQPLYYFSTVSHDSYPFLATSFQWINGNKTLEVTLRSGVKWSDGQPFTADDVLFTFNLLKQYPAADTNGVMKVVQTVVKNGDNKVDFNFNSPNIPFQEYVLGVPIVPEHQWKSLGDASKVTMTKPIGTGPYTLESFSAQEYKFKKNMSYFDAKDYAVPELNFPAYDSNESAQLALAQGDLDYAGLFIPNINKVFVANDKTNNKYWYPAGSPVMLYPNLKNPLLKDVNVRKAISMAIDRNKIVQQAEFGYPQVSSPTGVQPRDTDYIAPKYANLKFAQNQSGAIQLLENAGYKKGSDGIFVSPSGKKLSFTLQVVSGWSDWVSTCSLISQELKQIGIQVQVVQPQFGAYMSTLQSGNFDLAISWTNSGSTPYKTFEDLLNTNGGWNLEKWSDPATDAVLNDMKSTTDVAKQKADMAKIEDVMVNQVPTIPLFYGPFWYEYSTKKYTGWPDTTNSYATPSPSQNSAVAVILSKLKPVGN